ncbi:MAG TPA: TrkH family potassium uptake protein [Thermopetrobacter sp.]|nr:TrkH family potassium uptake protein [Thermopetrobacter sp.]
MAIVNGTASAGALRDLSPVLKVIGVLLLIIGSLMMLPALADLVFDDADWAVFVGSAFITVAIGALLLISHNRPIRALSTRQAILIVNLAWLSAAAFGALPFVFAETNLSAADAFFESMSGITTTGSTVLSGLDHMPHGILLWRALLQWMGGLGIIVTALAILPALNVGGMQMFKVEAFDIARKSFPRAREIAAGLVGVYVLLTFVCAVLLWLAGMRAFDAVAHALTTISTGGYSTRDASVGYFDSALIDAIITVGMVAGSVPFILYLQGRGSLAALWRSEQVRAFLLLLGWGALAIAVWLMVMRGYELPRALRYAAFNVTSVMTGTGYSSADYATWGALPVMLLAVYTLIGGCSGSTSCGMKVFRVQILLRFAVRQLRQLVMPSMVQPVAYEGARVREEVLTSVFSFFFLFLLTVAGLAVALAATGLDYVTALSGAATAVANVGPGFGPIIGPSGNFAPLSDTAIWLLSFGMLAGRLEILTFYAMLTRVFWRL